MGHVFVCYARKDLDKCKALVAWLSTRGINDIFFDASPEHGIGAGADWERTLYNQVSNATAMIVLVTQSWFESKWCFAEFSQARALGKLVIPVIDDAGVTTTISSDIQHLDLVGDREGGLLRLQAALGRTVPTRFPLPEPNATLALEEVSIAMPGTKKVSPVGISLRLKSGNSLGVVGPNGSGKTCLARALANELQPSRGTIRLDGASLQQWDAAVVARFIGYAPQEPTFKDGTIAENIARDGAQPNAEALIAASKAAGTHEYFLSLPDGYQSRITSSGREYSLGERHKISLTRALYGTPFLVVLDGVQTALDDNALHNFNLAVTAVCRRGGIAIVLAQQPRAVAALDFTISLDKTGRPELFGPTRDVLARLLPQLVKPPPMPPSPPNPPRDP